MNRFKWISTAVFATSFVLCGCMTAPDTQSGREDLHDTVNVSLHELEYTDPGLTVFLKNSYGYVVFPNVGKGAIGVGGAYGHGEVYEQGVFVGFADISQGTIGVQAGGQSFTELLAFQDKAALDDFKSGQFRFDANASAVALKAGAAATAKFDHGVAVFAEPQAGLMFEAAIGGQSFTYVPKQ
jgi:lipid-binding SYLF domain-containing protein